MTKVIKEWPSADTWFPLRLIETDGKFLFQFSAEGSRWHEIGKSYIPDPSPETALKHFYSFKSVPHPHYEDMKKTLESAQIKPTKIKRDYLERFRNLLGE